MASVLEEASLPDFANTADLKVCPSVRLEFQVGLDALAPLEKVRHEAV